MKTIVAQWYTNDLESIRKAVAKRYSCRAGEILFVSHPREVLEYAETHPHESLFVVSDYLFDHIEYTGVHLARELKREGGRMVVFILYTADRRRAYDPLIDCSILKDTALNPKHSVLTEILISKEFRNLMKV